MESSKILIQESNKITLGEKESLLLNLDVKNDKLSALTGQEII
jgi:hypothetical protein